jgi:uncharacterized membrane protein HdeD (DUF308 family)
MDRSIAIAKRGNPFRSDLSWYVILIEGLIAGGIGLYALLAPNSARRTIVLLIGIFLLLNGIGYAYRQLRSGGLAEPMAQFQLLRAGIGIATGLLIVINRISEFMGLNASRVVAGIGLIGIGAVTLIGIIMMRSEIEIRIPGIATAVGLIVWGIVLLYQANQDSSTSKLLGWFALIIGIALVALALLRRQRATATPAVAA